MLKHRVTIIKNKYHRQQYFSIVSYIYISMSEWVSMGERERDIQRISKTSMNFFSFLLHFFFSFFNELFFFIVKREKYDYVLSWFSLSRSLCDSIKCLKLHNNKKKLDIFHKHMHGDGFASIRISSRKRNSLKAWTYRYKRESERRQ